MSKIMYKFKSTAETYRVAVILVTHTNGPQDHQIDPISY